LIGFAIIAVFCGALAAWSVMAPLQSAVVAPGLVSVDSNVRTVQHLEGGIIEDIRVREGDEVTAGEILIRLSNTVPMSELGEAQARFYELRALEARLIAERDGRERIAFPPDMTRKVGDIAAQEAMDAQVDAFERRKRLIADRLGVIERTQEGLESEIIGLEGQIKASESQLTLLEEEIGIVAKLMERGLAERPRHMALLREKAELQGLISSNKAAIGTARQRIEEARLRKAELRTSDDNRVVKELAATRAALYEVEKDLAAARDVMQRTDIRAPVAGVVNNLRVTTDGGVIGPGEKLLDIVPVNDELVVRASIDPRDIDRVRVGMPATVWFTALNRRSQAAVEGTVQTISADRIVDPRTGGAYYLSRIRLSQDDIQASGVPLQTGMSAEVMILTGARTTWDYISAPLRRGIARALREE
jgi:HlyD family type I secretion membrane fusion protein